MGCQWSVLSPRLVPAGIDLRHLVFATFLFCEVTLFPLHTVPFGRTSPSAANTHEVGWGGDRCLYKSPGIFFARDVPPLSTQLFIRLLIYTSMEL